MDVLFPYSESKLKPFLKMATQRISISNNKRGTASKKHKREIAKLLEDGKLEKAIIRVEHVIRDDYTMESYEIIELMCDLLYERAKHLTKSELCPPDLVEAVSTVIWASSRVDISELEGARKQLQKKYGREFVELCDENSHGTVNSRVMHKLNVAPPGNLLIRSYLQEIAKEFCVAWDDETFPIQEDGSYRDGHQIGYSTPMAPSSGLGGVYEQQMGQNIPTPMTSSGLPPGYGDAQFHPTTEVGYQHEGQAQGQGKYVEEDVHPPQYDEATKPEFVPPTPPQQQLPQQPQQQPHVQQHPQQQQQQHVQQQQPPPVDPSSNDTPGATPSYDDLMARFKTLKD